MKHLLTVMPLVFATLAVPLSAQTIDPKEAEARPFATADKDGDRRISRAEYVHFFSKVLKTMDETKAGERFDAHDKDRDGYHSRQEFRASRADETKPKQ